MRTVDLEAWRGRRDAAPLDPQSMVLQARPARSKDGCRGCAFEGQWTSVCREAASRAVASGMPDCDAGFTYVEVITNQKDLFQITGA